MKWRSMVPGSAWQPAQVREPSRGEASPGWVPCGVKSAAAAPVAAKASARSRATILAPAISSLRCLPAATDTTDSARTRHGFEKRRRTLQLPVQGADHRRSSTNPYPHKSTKETCMQLDLALIGGTGLYQFPGLENANKLSVETPS